MSKYFRITGYYEKEDFCFIIDSNGMFDKLWEFSSLLVQKGLKVLEVGNADKFIDVNINPREEDREHIILRAHEKGKPNYINQTINGITYKAVKVGTKIYIPNKEKMI